MPFDATKFSKAACESLTARDDVLNRDLFPANFASTSFAIHDLGYLQKLASNEDNFASQTDCDIFSVDALGIGTWMLNAGDRELLQYLQTNTTAVARFFFFKLEVKASASFGFNVSMSRHSRQEVLQGLRLNPHFITFLLGLYAVNHTPPTGLDVLDDRGNLQGIDFICQQPRWGFRERISPISTLSSVDLATGVVTCVTSASASDPRLNTVRSRLTAALTGPGVPQAGLLNVSNPTMLPCLITHECFMASNYRVVELASTLFGSVDTIDESRQGPFDREVFKDLTFKLHRVSQDADFLVSSVEIGITMMDAMMETQSRTAKSIKQHHKLDHQSDTLHFLKRALESRRRWLYNAKSKKDTAMNLVYNIVSQQDTEANMAIAKDTKDDSSSMKTIAVLTMVFLPASTMASFFGMCFFQNDRPGFTVDQQVWLYPAVTVPTTLLVLFVWWSWNSGTNVGKAPVRLWKRQGFSVESRVEEGKHERTHSD
ncbi:hypothetical protein CAC42_3448 [Sphaceloma murrayae]|uniref:Uncharacterized protein n=1 Tax=Sphaceloma murrayae TaxID=2082308 RepID=A0A2K1R1I3_9PEZI|nr:hypothetical protein CAC42_3448 [Sphaceloma murrayae]